MTGTRDQIAAALFDKLVDAWDWSETGRRLKLPPDVASRPAIFLVQVGGSTSRQQQLKVRTMEFLAVIYTRSPQSEATIPAAEQNAILDAIDAALDPSFAEPGRQTLGGLCHWCYIDGETPQVPGDIDGNGDGRMVVPIKVVIP